MRQDKSDDIVKMFRRLLKKYPYYTREGLYEMIGEKFYLTPSRIQDYIRSYYCEKVTPELIEKYESALKSHPDNVVDRFASLVPINKPEAKVLINYIKRRI